MEAILYIGWGFAALSAIGGVAFLTVMAYRQPKKRSSRKE